MNADVRYGAGEAAQRWRHKSLAYRIGSPDDGVRWTV
jgi:hypothetical protein